MRAVSTVTAKKKLRISDISHTHRRVVCLCSACVRSDWERLKGRAFVAGLVLRELLSPLGELLLQLQLEPEDEEEELCDVRYGTVTDHRLLGLRRGSASDRGVRVE